MSVNLLGSADPITTSGAGVLVRLHAFVQALTLYEADNRGIERPMQALDGSLREAFATGADELRLDLMPEECFVNGRLLRVDATLWSRANALAMMLERLGVGRITFLRGCDLAELERFAAALSKRFRGQGGPLPEDAWEHIRTGRGGGRSVASYRTEPDQLAVQLYGALIDQVERITEEADADRTPSLLPLRRLLQLLIDSTRDRGHLVPLLTELRPPDSSPSPLQRRCAMAVEAVAFGIFLGLGNAEIMTLALAAILPVLSDDPDPDLAVRPLFAYPGLGGAAIGVLLAMHDARTREGDGPRTLPGRALAVIEAYRDLVDGKEAVAAAVAVDRLARGHVPRIAPSMALLFARHKGGNPVGSLVRLSDGKTAIVLARSRLDGEDRLRVALITRNGRLGARLTVHADSAPSVVGTPSPRELGLDLSRVGRPL